MANEAKIRNYLARDLSIIENDLKLIKVEYPLQNPHGTSGKIDILARDLFGHHVVIEIKKSDKTARETLHELYKYVALLQINLGLPAESIRCIIISTCWSELLLPFSEFTRTFKHSVTGYQIDVNHEGYPQGIKPIKPVPESHERELCPEHVIFLYTKKSPV